MVEVEVEMMISRAASLRLESDCAAATAKGRRESDREKGKKWRKEYRNGERNTREAIGAFCSSGK